MVAEDEALLCNIYASTREQELGLLDWTPEQKKAFVRMQFEAQTTYYRQVYPDMEYTIILHDGEEAGRMMVAQLEDEFRLVDITILPAHRNAGIGRTMLRQLMDRAAGEGKMVRLHIEQFNRARRLYENLGFRDVADKGVYIMMEWQPGTALEGVNREPLQEQR